MNNKVHQINFGEEAKLHYMKKIKGEAIEKVENLKLYGAECEVLREIIQFLDNRIYELEEELRNNKKRERENEEVKTRSRYDY